MASAREGGRILEALVDDVQRLGIDRSGGHPRPSHRRRPGVAFRLFGLLFAPPYATRRRGFATIPPPQPAWRNR